MTEKIIIAGAGGQGIMLAGKVLAEAAMRENKYVTWLPCYGAEVRGGAAYCMIIISDAEISSPYVDKADTLIIMNNPSLEKFKPKLKNRGLLIVNSSLAKKNKGCGINQPFTDIAVKLGNIKVANMVALGCYLAKRNVINMKNVFQTIEKMAPAEKKGLIAINKLALEEGMKLR